MPAYHQMGNDSRNLLSEVSGFRGAIISPVNESESDVRKMVDEHASDSFEFIFDPQLYFPRRGDRGRLAEWSYFPKDFDTADMTSEAWWNSTLDSLATTAKRVNSRAVCSPAFIARFSNEYYEFTRGLADRLVEPAAEKGLRVLQTVIARLEDLVSPNRVLEIASIVSSSAAPEIYLVLLSDVKPREELRDVDQLKGAMKLIRLLEDAGLSVLVGCSSSDVLLWKAAGASSCATGKFANLRRFTPGRFNEQEDGGRQMAYWLDEALVAFLRESDLLRVWPLALANTLGNPFAAAIQKKIANEPAKPWVALGWRQYMYWFATVEQRLTNGSATARSLVQAAECSWQLLEERNVFLEERANNGAWLRPWLRAIVEFDK